MQEIWPLDFWHWGRILLHQQCWCWGQDVRAPQGNLLCAFGFKRERPVTPSTLGTRYTLCRPNGLEIRLWAFGMLVVHPQEGGVYLGRYSFVPCWIPEPELVQQAWKAEEFAPYHPPRTRRDIRFSRRLLRWTLQFLSEYESWVIGHRGLSWRRTALREWHEPAVLPERVPQEWLKLSWHIPEPPLFLPCPVSSPNSLEPARSR
jgi:hypothetical protein